MLSVGDSIANDGFEEGFEDTTSLFIDHGLYGLSVKSEGKTENNFTHRDTLDTSTTGETTNGRLGDTLDVVSKNLAMAFCTALAETLATFTTCSPNQHIVERGT